MTRCTCFLPHTQRMIKWHFSRIHPLREIQFSIWCFIVHSLCGTTREKKSNKNNNKTNGSSNSKKRRRKRKRNENTATCLATSPAHHNFYKSSDLIKGVWLRNKRKSESNKTQKMSLVTRARTADVRGKKDKKQFFLFSLDSMSCLPSDADGCKEYVIST